MKALYLTLAVAAFVCCLAGCGGKMAHVPTPVPTDSLEYSNRGGSVRYTLCRGQAVHDGRGKGSAEVTGFHFI